MEQNFKHEPGSFCWSELGTTDAEAASRFYGGLFGWEFRLNNSCPDCEYTTVSIGGQTLAGMYPLCKDMLDKGVPPHWMAYVAVEDAAAVAASAAAHGGEVICGPMDVMDLGKMAVLRDPQGAVFSVWQPLSHAGSAVRDVPGTPCWNELCVKDPEAVLAFYGAVLGWEAVRHEMPSGPYYVFSKNDLMRGGMMAIDPAWGEVPPHWAIYFAVADCDAAAAQAQAGGGKICLPPTDIPGVGRFAVITDPQGAVFSIIRMAPPECGCGCCG